MMTLDEIKQAFKESRGQAEEMNAYLDISAKRAQLEKLEAEAAAPEFWNDQEQAQKNIAAANALRAVLEPYAEVAAAVEDLSVTLELVAMEDDPEAADEMRADAERLVKKLTGSIEKIELQSLLSGPLDRNNAYVSIHAGAGGTESCDWADMLFRMYLRYAEREGFSSSVIDAQPGEEAGIKSATIHICGPFAYGYLKSERGVHRLVRISPFDSNSRRHTSFAALDVIAEVDDDIDIEIDEKDLRIDTYRASGAGGQHVNKTDSAVRITHLPTNIIVQCQNERSQHKNKATAMKILTAKLYEYEQDKKRKQMEQFYGNKGEIAWGSQIRSYVMQPYTMVNDHRTELKKGNVEAVLDGDLNEFIEAYLKHERRSKGE
jgi:peptide chain release factor 2